MNDPRRSCRTKFRGISVQLGCFLALAITASLSASCQTETVLYSFDGSPDNGYYPNGVIMDASGNLFGTTSSGSQTLCDLGEVNGCGVIFELAKSSNGYTETVLYSFGSNSTTSDGASPFAGLIMDALGNLYGTTTYGGSDQCLIDLGADGCGTVFELVKSSNGYIEKILYTFTGSDGAYPLAALVIDSAGNLFGTTSNGGDSGNGTVFELVNSGGNYTFSSLYSFSNSPSDGSQPVAGLLIDGSGNLYGTTEAGGDLTQCAGFGCGTVFELVKSSSGYTHNVLYGFKGTNGTVGQGPAAGLIMDASGNLYGTTQGGGNFDCGTVFELVNSSGKYTENVLYSFKCLNNNDGETPAANLLMDASGDIYGTASRGGAGCVPDGCGSVFELANSSGTYVYKVLHNFGAPNDGENPTGALVMDTLGNLYGTTAVGGVLQLGTVFQVNPNAPAPEAMLSVSNVSFSSQLVNTSSSPQSITVTNGGQANLVFSTGAVTISGANAPEFAISADMCSGAVVPVNRTCAVSVTFTPAIVGASNAVLTFADNAPNSLQNVVLSGTGVVAPDFTIGATSGSSTSATVSPGSSGTYSLSVAPVGGYKQPVMVACSGAPLLAVCSVSPATASLDGTNAVPVTVTVATTAPMAASLHVSTPPTLALFASILAFPLTFWLLPLKSKSYNARLSLSAMLVVVIGFSLACGGGGTSAQSGSPGTPRGTYTLTVTGTSGPLTHSTALTLVVQ